MVPGFVIIEPVGTTSTEPITTVRPAAAPARCESLAAANMSNAKRQSIPAALAWFDDSGAWRLTRTSLETGPAF